MRKAILLSAFIFSSMLYADETSFAGKWFVSESKDKLTDNVTVNAWITNKDAYIKGRLARDISISARCSNNKTEAFISFEDIVSHDGTQVAYRLDDGEVVKEKWSRAEGGQGLFSPNSIKFLKNLKEHRKLTFGFTPYASEMVAIDFDISGVDEMIKHISDACNWKF